MALHPGVAWIRKHMPELEHDYPNEYVAADANGLVAHGLDLAVVLEKIQQEGRKFGDVIWAKIPAETEVEG